MLLISAVAAVWNFIKVVKLEMKWKLTFLACS